MSEISLNSLSVQEQQPKADSEPVGAPVKGNRFKPVSLHELTFTVQAGLDWIWAGYLARGNITLMTSQWKCGKTTLLSVLLARMNGGGTLAGRAVQAGRAVVISEEAATNWLARSQRLDFGPNAGWLCRPFRGRPRPGEWLDLLDCLEDRHRQVGLDLVVIDPLAAFLPGHAENDAGTMLDALLPLQRLTELGVAVLVLHHPKKGEPAPGQAARGSGALSGCVDILIEMRYAAGPADDDRRRRLLAFSRHPQTPRRLVIELNAEGTDYLAHGDFRDQDDAGGWAVARAILEDASSKQSRREILDGWPSDDHRPDELTLSRWLEAAVARQEVRREGTGRRNHPYRYWLPGQEELWALDPFHLEDLPPLEDGMEIARRRLAELRQTLGKDGRTGRR